MNRRDKSYKNILFFKVRTKNDKSDTFIVFLFRHFNDAYFSILKGMLIFQSVMIFWVKESERSTNYDISSDFFFVCAYIFY